MLTKQTPATAAQCGANGELSSPSGGARHQKVGNVKARNQENATCCGQQHVQRRLDISGFQSSDCQIVVAIQSFHVLRGLFVVNRGPQLHALFWIGKPGWHDTDDLVGLRVKTYRLPQNRGVASEASLP